jgi:MYXO-CTERM domain-containing protein
LGALYAPKNVVAIWIEGPANANTAGPFVKTIGRWAELRKVDLVAWRAKAGINDTDAISGATRLDHNDTLTVAWDLKNKLGVLVPDGVYTVRMEMADGNSTTTGQNNQGTFTFTKGLVPDTKTITVDPPNATPTGPIFPKWTDVSIDFNPTAGECNNNVIDPGETCDPPGSCPTTCAAPDTCSTAVLVGSAALCTSACTIAKITTCVNGDGCCVDGCAASEDDDCAAPAAADLNAGCAASNGEGHGPLIAFALFGAAALFTRRRRR